MDYENDEDNSDQSDYSSAVTDNYSEELERKFFYAITSCDIGTVNVVLQKKSYSDFDINCKNYQGMTGLNLAIQVNCESIVDLLIKQSGLEIGDSLMHAIRENFYSVVVKLLDILESKDPEKVKQGYEHSTEFPKHLTPLMLAAQCGHYTIIKLLLSRGHTIPIPHKPGCNCLEVCTFLNLNNGLEATELRLSVFRALTSPAYIAQTSKDPILIAFQLSKTLRDHGNVDCVFKSDYESLNFHTRMFAVHMIGLCRSSAEVEMVLTIKEGCNFFCSFSHHRLVMAMDLKQKEFVAHAYVQQSLEMAWIGDWYEWKQYVLIYKGCVLIRQIFILPVITVCYLAFPKSEWTRHYSLPVNRMLNYLATYAIFLMILTYENIYNKTNSKIDSPDWIFKIILVVYVVSFIFRTVKLIILQGPKRYFSMLWNLYDCATLIMLTVISYFWWLSFMKIQVDDDVSSESVERKFWHPLDQDLIVEGLMAIVTVMSYMRLLFLCQLSYDLGPMQVSLGKMTTDFARFALLLCIFLLAFTAGLCRFYQYYDGMTRTDPVTGSSVQQDESFVSVSSTLKTLFWGMFCMTSSTAGSVVIDNALADNETKEEVVVSNHYFTQAVGTALYSFFEIFSVLVMLNMLIATMSNTFMRVTGNSYIEWVFGRTQVFLFFFMHTDLPPPLNLIPSYQLCKEIFLWLFNFYKYIGNVYEKLTSPKSLVESYSKEEFTRLMGKLVKRYFRDKLSTAFVRKCNPICG